LDIVEGSAPSEMKNETANRVGTINVGTLNIHGAFGSTNRRMMMVLNLD
jgi:hypothetical protein